MHAYISIYIYIRRTQLPASTAGGHKNCSPSPSTAFRPVARFFNWAEATFGDDLPKMLTCTKQIILHKPRPADAMNKRLITILPALLLSYTGARYMQLQVWQERTMPKEIVGGIKGRTMPQLHTALRLDIDEARAFRHDHHRSQA